MQEKKQKIVPKHVFAIAVISSFIFTSAILFSGTNLGIQDWDINLGFIEAARRSILVYRQIPLWNPYHCGGAPLLGNAQTSVISLYSFFSLIFGTIIGVKISIFVNYIVGFLGFYLLARKHFSVSSLSAIFGSIIFTFCGVVSSALGTGMNSFLSFFYIPYVFYFLLNSLQEKPIKNTFLSGLFLALSFYMGYHMVLWFFPILIFYAILLSLKKRRLLPILATLLIFIFFAIISLPKLYGSIEFERDHPRIIDDMSGFKITQIPNFLFNKTQLYHPKELISESFQLGVDEQSVYIGAIPFVFFLIGIFYLKGRWELFVVLLFSLWFMLGANIQPSIWEYLKTFNIYNNARVAERFRYPFILFLALISSFGIGGFFGWIKKSAHKNKIITLILITVFVDLTLFSYGNFFSKIFIIKDEDWDIKPLIGQFQNQYKIDSKSKYHYSNNIPEYLKNTYAYVLYSKDFIAAKENLGSVGCADAVETIITGQVKGRDEADYKGEAYFLDSGRKVDYFYWSPNKLVLKVEQGVPGRLIINQNYDDNWLVKVNGKVYEADSYKRILSFEVGENMQEIEFIYKYTPLRDY